MYGFVENFYDKLVYERSIYGGITIPRNHKCKTARGKNCEFQLYLKGLNSNG